MTKYLVLFLLPISSFLNAQEMLPDSSIQSFFSLDEYTEYITAYSPPYLLIIGGTIKSETAEQENFPNSDIILIDWEKQLAIASTVWNFPVAVAEQLMACEAGVFQEADTLYVVGGYGYSDRCRCYKTFDSLIKVNIKQMIDLLINGKSIAPSHKQVLDERMAVAYGFLEKVNDVFFLFEGRMIDDRPAIEDECFLSVNDYANEVRTFKLIEKGNNLQITNFSVWTDQDHFFDAFEEYIPSTSYGNKEYFFESFWYE